MNKNSTKPGNFDEEVVFCLERQMIPAWERYGMNHLAVSANTLAAFREQPLPEQLRSWKKKRKSSEAVAHRGTAKSSALIKSWPKDNLESLRFPVLAYVRAGQTEFQMGDYVVSCPQEHFLLLSPGVPQPAGKKPHLEEPRQGKHCEIWRFTSSGNFDQVILSVCYSEGDKHANSGHYYIVNDLHTVQLFLIFSQEIESRSPFYQKAGYAALQAFLHLFLREIKAGRFYNRGVDNPKPADRLASPIEMAQQYIDKNLNHPLTIAIVAQAVFMARTNFTRQFREETGKTFQQYLTEQRLKEAKHWLSQESCSIEIACKFVGLKYSRLHQLFLQHFGMTPSQFRKQQKNG